MNRSNEISTFWSVSARDAIDCMGTECQTLIGLEYLDFLIVLTLDILYRNIKHKSLILDRK